MTTRRTIARRIARSINSYPKGRPCYFDKDGTYVQPYDNVRYVFDGVYPNHVTVENIENDLKNLEKERQNG